MGEVDAALDAGVEDYGVERGVGGCYSVRVEGVVWDCIIKEGKTYFLIRAGISARSVMSNWTVETLSLP